MEILNDNKFTLFEMPTKKSKARGQRACLIEDFCTELNKEVGKKYKKGDKLFIIKKVTPSYISFRLSHLNISELFYFLSECKQYKQGFSKYFYGTLKVRK